MKITVDTNVLVRATVVDDENQANLAIAALREAELIAVPLPVLCEFVWVLARGYKKPVSDIVEAIRRLVDSVNVTSDRPAVDFGLKVFEAGGDFADGVIAFKGHRLGGVVFTSFDRGAVEVLQATGTEARLLSNKPGAEN